MSEQQESVNVSVSRYESAASSSNGIVKTVSIILNIIWIYFIHILYKMIDDCAFEYEPLKTDDVTFSHDFVVNTPNVTITYCIELVFQGYKQGECMGIKSLIPGQKITQNNTE